MRQCLRARKYLAFRQATQEARGRGHNGCSFTLPPSTPVPKNPSSFQGIQAFRNKTAPKRITLALKQANK